MKKVQNSVFTMMVALATLSVVFTSCGGDDDGKEEAKFIPTNLAVTDITVTSAKLTWEGTAEAYEITFSDEVLDTIGAVNSYAISGLHIDSAYTWKVRAKKGTKFSAYAEPDTFRTKYEKGVFISFGDDVTFKAGQLSVTAYPTPKWIRFDAAKTGFGVFPFLKFQSGYDVGETVFDGIDHFYFEYFEKTDTVASSPGVWHGDWWADYNGTPAPKLVITKHENEKISGYGTITLINAIELRKGVAAPTKKTLKIDFADVVAGDAI